MQAIAVQPYGVANTQGACDEARMVKDLFSIVVGLIVSALAAAPFFFHVLRTVESRDYTLLVIGILIPPIGFFHGISTILSLW